MILFQVLTLPNHLTWCMAELQKLHKNTVNHNYTCFITSRKDGDRKLGTSKWNFPCIAVLSCCLQKQQDRMIMEWIASCNGRKTTLTELRMPCVQAEPGKSRMTKMMPRQKQLQNRTASYSELFVFFQGVCWNAVACELQVMKSSQREMKLCDRPLGLN